MTELNKSDLTKYTSLSKYELSLFHDLSEYMEVPCDRFCKEGDTFNLEQETIGRWPYVTIWKTTNNKVIGVRIFYMTGGSDPYGFRYFLHKSRIHSDNVERN